MKNIIITVIAMLSMSGCATKVPIVIDDIVKQREGVATVVITSPQRMFPLGALAALKHFDYYLNCLEDKCKVARMQIDQHAVIYTQGGKQTLYVVDTTKEVDLLRDTIIINIKPIVFEFEAIENKKHFIKHEWDIVSWGVFLPIALPGAHLELIGEEEARARLEEVEKNFLVFGERGETF